MIGLLIATARSWWARWRGVVLLALMFLGVAVPMAWLLTGGGSAKLAPVAIPPAVVKADAAAAHADTVYRIVTDTVIKRVATYDGARAKVPANRTADSAGTVRVDTAFVNAADSLRAAMPLLEAAAIARHAADSAQVAALRNFTESLRAELATAEPKCKVLGVGCPSRKQAFVAGAVVGSVGIVVLVARWAR